MNLAFINWFVTWIKRIKEIKRLGNKENSFIIRGDFTNLMCFGTDSFIYLFIKILRLVVEMCHYWSTWYELKTAKNLLTTILSINYNKKKVQNVISVSTFKLII